MKIVIGADHKGLAFKDRIAEILKKLGHKVSDFGTKSEVSVDYPDYGSKVAHAVANGEADYGITVCWTGNGMNMVANKIRGVRAGMALNADMAFQASEGTKLNCTGIPVDPKST